MATVRRRRPGSTGARAAGPARHAGPSGLARGLVLALILTGCSGDPTDGTASPPTISATSPVASSTRLPIAPPTAIQSLGPNQPPVVWIGGTLLALHEGRVMVREGSGSSISLVRLAGGATGFFVVSGDQWVRLPPDAEIEVGQPVCVEALMGGGSLVAIRVFLGAGCGPA